MKNNYIGENIRQQRKKLKIPIKNIQHELGVSRNTVQNIEKKGAFGKNFIKYILLLRKKGVNLNTLFKDNTNTSK